MNSLRFNVLVAKKLHRLPGLTSKNVNMQHLTRSCSAMDVAVTKSLGSHLNVTTSCASRILELSKEKSEGRPEDYYLRVYVDAGGCSGFQYKFELESEEIEDDDLIFEQDGARVVVDESSLDLLQGSTVDFVQEMIRSSFVISENPQSESACGCGSSFAVKNFEANPAQD